MLRSALAALALLSAPSGLAAGTAEPLAAPLGEVVLTISGAIDTANQGTVAAFDLAMLQSMEPASITTTTIWTQGEQQFTGVRLKTLMDRLGATGKPIEARALNDYFTEIPAEDITEDGPIIAYAQNGNFLSVRDKGPLWIVYPYDEDSRWRSEVIYTRSIWQLNALVVLP